MAQERLENTAEGRLRLQQALDLWHKHDHARRAAAAEMGIPPRTMDNLLERARAIGLVPGGHAEGKLTSERLIAVLRRGQHSVEDLSALFHVGDGRIRTEIKALLKDHVDVYESDGRFSIERERAPSYAKGPTLEYLSRPDNTYVFGALGDTHLGSKYAREDVLNDLYRRYAEVEVDRVFHTGNWIEGESRFNRYDLNIHGMDAQCRHLADAYPERERIHTYAVAGDDHEGWYAQREGVNIGRYAEQCFRDIGRKDWHDIGYMEAHVELVNANTGATATLAVVHPGGGSAYADSYSVQKIVESLEGGEKPAVALYGHYHKMLAGEYRNVWWLQTGCTKDQDPYARKKRLRYAVGGAIVTLEQDPESGAIVGFAPRMFRYFNRGFYEGRWSHSGDVTQPKRST